jgi:hypothetical protein
VVVAPSCACNAAAFKDATRNGGFTAKVPCAVDVETDEVPVLEPQADSTATITAAPEVINNLNMAVPLKTNPPWLYALTLSDDAVCAAARSLHE